MPGTSLPSYHGIMAAPPVVLGASGDADSTTRSAVGGGALNITNSAAQQQLTGQTAEEAAAGISRDTNNTVGALAPIFDRDKIEAGFEITGQFVNQVGQFVQNRATEADAAQKAANDPTLTPEQRAAAQQQADQLNADWGPNGTYRQALTALTVAAGGNVTGSMGELAQNAAVAYVQGLGANKVKQLVSLIGDGTAEGETTRAALQAIVGCAGAAASSQACGAGAMGAASSSLIGWALGPADGLSAADKQARGNLVNSLVGAVAIATSGGSGAATVAGAGQTEVENNQLSPPVAVSSSSLPGWLVALGKLPGFKGETAGKGGGVTADPVTELDPTIKAGTPMASAFSAGGWSFLASGIFRLTFRLGDDEVMLLITALLFVLLFLVFAKYLPKPLRRAGMLSEDPAKFGPWFKG